MVTLLCLPIVHMHVYSQIIDPQDTTEDTIDKEKESTQRTKKEPDNEIRTQLAVSTPSYPVTPGDIYILEYTHGMERQEMTLIVESDYTVNLSVFGKINVRGKTFLDFRSKVDTLVSEAYPESFHQLILRSVGIFTVEIKGEVDRAQEVTAWGMTRLGSLVSEHLTEYSSIRDVTIIDHQGDAGTYDLFQAQRYGRLDQNPYVKPGDTDRKSVV